MYKKILVALDESEMASKALQQAAQLAKAVGSEKISIIHVTINSLFMREFTGSIDLETLLDKENEYVLSGAIKFLKDENIAYETHSFQGYEAGQIISDYANEHNYDLVVVGRTGKGMVKGTLLGSVSNKIASAAKCPVLIIK